ncbi:Uncharacterised protein [Mycobacteroides abscessus subsp. massiliense]|nr:Uncharacterised protein [Mycobacteroides abscessus subsp. massiliense]
MFSLVEVLTNRFVGFAGGVETARGRLPGDGKRFLPKLLGVLPLVVGGLEVAARFQYHFQIDPHRAGLWRIHPLERLLEFGFRFRESAFQYVPVALREVGLV